MPSDRPPAPDPYGAAVDDLGPFETEQQVRQLPAVRAVYDAFDRDPGAGKMAPHNLRLLLDALAAAGVYLGAYDHRIAEWLAGWEPATVAVIAGWVQRAGQADGQAAARTAMGEGPPGAAAARPSSRATASHHADPPPAKAARSCSTVQPGAVTAANPAREAR